jgi:quinol monooxygenase YgiN
MKVSAQKASRPARSVGNVRLTGSFRCATLEDSALVKRLLPEHIRLTLAEAGCLSFTVLPQADGLTWAVDETFADRAAFTAHQQRTAASDWGRATPHIPRSFRIDERSSGLVSQDKPDHG